MLDRKKDEESARPAPETAPDNDDPKSAAEPAYVPTPATPKPPAAGLPGMPMIPRRLANIPPVSRPAGDGCPSHKFHPAQKLWYLRRPSDWLGWLRRRTSG